MKTVRLLRAAEVVGVRPSVDSIGRAAKPGRVAWACTAPAVGPAGRLRCGARARGARPNSRRSLRSLCSDKRPRVRSCERAQRARAAPANGSDQGAKHSRSTCYGEHLQRGAGPFAGDERVWWVRSQLLGLRSALRAPPRDLRSSPPTRRTPRAPAPASLRQGFDSGHSQLLTARKTSRCGVHLVTRARELVRLRISISPKRHPASARGRGAVGGDFWSGEQRRDSGGARSALRELTRGRLSERSERSERSEFGRAPGSRAAQRSRRAAPTAEA